MWLQTWALALSRHCGKSIEWLLYKRISKEFTVGSPEPFVFHAQSPIPLRSISPHFFTAYISNHPNANPFSDRLVLHGFFCDQRSHAGHDGRRGLVYLHRERLESGSVSVTLTNFDLATAVTMPASVMNWKLFRIPQR
jgi:hypothetical protein